jgi:hypothetical protein
MTNREILEALSQKKNEPWSRAIMAIMDGCIEEARQEAEVRGQDSTIRIEANGGANYLRACKAELAEWLDRTLNEPLKNGSDEYISAQESTEDDS